MASFNFPLTDCGADYHLKNTVSKVLLYGVNIYWRSDVSTPPPSDQWIWVRTDDGNNLYFNDGTGWVLLGGGSGTPISSGLYDNDVDAANNGIILGGYYNLSANNDWDLPEGLVKRRTT